MMVLSEPVDVSGQTLELIGVGEGKSDKSTVELSTTSVSDRFSTPDTSQETVDMVGSQEVMHLTKVEEFQEKNRLEREGNLEMNERRCWKHKLPPDCKECDLEAQFNQGEEEVLDKLEGYLEVVEDENGTKSIQAKYLFKECPKKLFEKSNRKEVLKNTLKVVKRMLTKMPMEEVVAVYNRGIDEGCFQVLTTEEEALILKNPHTYCTTQLALNEKSKSTKVRFISNASCHTGREFTNLNEASVRPPNLTNKLTSALLSFIMFYLPYSSDISHAYRTIKVHPDHWPYQLLIGFNFDQEDWWNYPVTIVQKNLLYGNIQSQLILELAIRRIIGPTIENLEVRETIMFRRIVDNMVTSFRDPAKMEEVCNDIFSKFKEFNMNLKSRVDSTKEYHGDEWTESMKEDILIGLKWDRAQDTVTPKISVNKGKKIGGKAVTKDVNEDPLEATEVTRRIFLRCSMQLFDSLQRSLASHQITAKLLYARITKTMNDQELDEPVYLRDKNLAGEAADFVNNIMTKLDRIMLFPEHWWQEMTL